jgi:hypothetical protein
MARKKEPTIRESVAVLVSQMTDVQSCLKDEIKPCISKIDSHLDKVDKDTETNKTHIGWITWAVRAIILALITSSITLGYFVYKNSINGKLYAETEEVKRR